MSKLQVSKKPCKEFESFAVGSFSGTRMLLCASFRKSQMTWFVEGGQKSESSPGLIPVGHIQVLLLIHEVKTGIWDLS